MDELLEEYRETRRQVRRAWERAGAADRQLLAGMVADLDWSIEFMETGWEPATLVRGRPRRSVPVGFDPRLIPGARALWQNLADRGVEEGAARRSTLEGLLQHLTSLERDVYLMVVGNGVSVRETARFMGLSRRYVRDLHTSAVAKVNSQASRYRPPAGY